MQMMVRNCQMKRLVKIVSAVLGLAIFCLLSSCSAFSSEEDKANLKTKTAEMIDNIKSLDNDTFSMISKVMDKERKLLDLSDADNYKNLKLVMKNFTYEITNAYIQGNDAFVDITVHNVNMENLFLKATFAMQQQGMYSPGSGSNKNSVVLDGKEGEKLFRQYLKKAKKQDYTQSVQLHFKFVNGTWQWQLNREVLDAVTGNYFTAYLSLTGG